MVALPPRLAQKTSASIMGTGLILRSLEISAVTAARNMITVMESMNILSTALSIIKITKMGAGR